jgi:hypothetical protein
MYLLTNCIGSSWSTLGSGINTCLSPFLFLLCPCEMPCEIVGGFFANIGGLFSPIRGGIVDLLSLSWLFSLFQTPCNWVAGLCSNPLGCCGLIMPILGQIPCVAQILTNVGCSSVSSALGGGGSSSILGFISSILGGGVGGGSSSCCGSAVGKMASP